MAIFKYHALTRNGQLMKGSLEASDEGQARSLLTDMNLDVQLIDIDKTHTTASAVNRSELLLFNQQLASLAASGIPLEKGIRQIASEVAGRPIRKLLEEIADDLEKGEPVEQVFEKRKSRFPLLYGKIMKAGIVSGRLSEMLVSLNKHLVTATQMRQAIIEAITYPLVIFFVAAIIITGIVTFIIPSFGVMYADMGSDLPAITEFLLMWPEFIGYFWLVLFLTVGGSYIIHLYSLRSFSMRVALEGVYSKIPFLGRMYFYNGLSRLADNLGLLINSGSDIPEALEMAAETTGRQSLIKECNKISSRIRHGENLVEATQDCTVIPGLFMYSAQLGIQRNELVDNMYSISEMYRQQTKIASGRLASVLTPVMIVCLGGSIAVVVLALFLPMVKMIEDLC